MKTPRITPDTLVNADPPMTAEESMIGAIRQGVYPWVAAEMVGIPRRQLAAWLRSKKRRYRKFALEIRKARAWARMVAEMALFKDDPRSWLKAGPGRETSAEPGWSKDVAPFLGKDERRPVHPLADPAWRELFGRMLDALTPYPEARTALATMLRAQEEQSASER